MKATVHWNIFDGRGGFPNINAELDWSDQEGRSYRDTIIGHAELKLSDKEFAMQLVNIEEVGMGKIRGSLYKDFDVSYKIKHHLPRGWHYKASFVPSGHPDDKKEPIIKKNIRVFRQN